MRIKQTTLESRLNKTRIEILSGDDPIICQSCGGNRNLDLSHLISRAEIKQFDLLELYYSALNLAWQCNEFGNGCHLHWENGTRKGEDFSRNMAFIQEATKDKPTLNQIIVNRWENCNERISFGGNVIKIEP
jgi:hypothetical protein